MSPYGYGRYTGNPSLDCNVSNNSESLAVGVVTQEITDNNNHSNNENNDSNNNNNNKFNPNFKALYKHVEEYQL